MFLSGMDVRWYHTDDVRSKFDVLSMEFERDGTVWTPYSGVAGWARDELYRDLDVSDHYEPWPEFGRYESLLRRQRSVPPGLGLEDDLAER